MARLTILQWACAAAILLAGTIAVFVVRAFAPPETLGQIEALPGVPARAEVGGSSGFDFGYRVPQPKAPEAEMTSSSGRYTDAEVRAIIDRWTAGNLNDESLLRVVPSGTAAPLVTVFGALGLDPARLGKPADCGFNMARYLTWRISPSYNLSAMTATNDPDNRGVEYTDSRRRLYGIRISKREE